MITSQHTKTSILRVLLMFPTSNTFDWSGALRPLDWNNEINMVFQNRRFLHSSKTTELILKILSLLGSYPIPGYIISRYRKKFPCDCETQLPSYIIHSSLSKQNEWSLVLEIKHYFSSLSTTHKTRIHPTKSKYTRLRICCASLGIEPGTASSTDQLSHNHYCCSNDDGTNVCSGTF